MELALHNTFANNKRKQITKRSCGGRHFVSNPAVPQLGPQDWTFPAKKQRSFSDSECHNPPFSYLRTSKNRVFRCIVRMILGWNFQHSRNRSCVRINYMPNQLCVVLIDQDNVDIIPFQETFETILDFTHGSIYTWEKFVDKKLANVTQQCSYFYRQP